MIQSGPRTLLLAALAPLAVLVPLAVVPQEAIDFAALGQEFLEIRCGEGATLSDWPVQRVLAERCATARLGAFEVNFPVDHFAEKSGPGNFTEIATALIELQRHWIAWSATSADKSEQALADVELLHDWVVGWNGKKLAKLARSKGSAADLDVAQTLGVPAEVAAAEERVWAFLHDAEQVALPLMQGKNVQLAFAPTRLDFMRWVGYSGLVEPDKRAGYWVAGVDEWTQIWSGWTMVTALEYAPWTGFDAEFKSSKSMKSFDKSGMVEQVCLQAGMSLLRHCADRELDHHDNAIAMNLVIEMVGQLNTIDGEAQVRSSGGKTQPYSRFIPGGLSSGGTLPGRSAQGLDGLVKNQWRKHKGSDNFHAALRNGQKDGYKAAAKKKAPHWKDKSAHFLLRSDTDQWVVSAPFLGPHAKDQAYPPTADLVEDFGEFFRAYKSGFHAWLRVHGDPDSEEGSAAKYRELLRGLGDIDHAEKTYGALFERVYGVPLSAADGESDTLEWRFLAFLEKVRA